MTDCSAMPALMKQRVTLQSRSATTDGQGGFSETWSNVADLWAYIKPMKGWERMQAMQLQTPLTHKVTLRYRPGVTTAMRLLYGSRILQIKEVINIDEEKRYLQLMCVETT